VSISELHESTVSVNEYDKILMIVTNFNITAQLSLLKELIQEFNRTEIYIRNLHLV